jgi:natural product biosynthesis luciferase-like monooxygenase protein
MPNSMTADSLYDLLLGRAESTPENNALLAPGRAPLTYRALVRQVEQAVGRLNSLGIARGERVALALPNGPEMLAAFLAVACGFQAAPLNPALSGGEFDAVLQDLRIGALIAPAGSASPARAAAERRRIPVVELSFAGTDPAGTFTFTAAKANSTPVPGPAFAAARDIALVLGTSGTTSRPKIVPAAQSAMIAGGKLTIDALHLTAADRYLCVMPMHHAHALMTSLAALLAGGLVIAVPPFDTDDFFRWLAEFRPTWYSSAPAIHRAILARAEAHSEIVAHRSLRFIRSSAAPLPPIVLAKLEEVFGAPVIEGYGMTETCLYATSNPLPPLRRKIGSVGIAVGVEVAILDESGVPLPTNQRGEIALRGANIITAYENDPGANAEAFADGWFRTGDQGYLDGDRYLFITGRLKETINRGGEKIAPGEVEEILAKHPDVAAAAVFAVPHATLGEDVAAAAVLRNDSRSSVFDLRRYVAARLVGHKVPGQILTVDAIPASSTGKVQRARLAEFFADRLRSDFVEPRNISEMRLAEVWQEVLDISSLSINDNFFALGGDSLRATQVVSRLRQRFNIEVSVRSLFFAPTIASLAREIGGDPALRASEAPPIEVCSPLLPAGSAPAACGGTGNLPLEQAAVAGARRMEFSLFFFSADGSVVRDDKYRLFLESLQFADQNGFTAIWTPERHFHPFGGLYPNPAILGAAAAALTKNIQIRAGSVVVPLQDPLRVAEEWSVIDNLSGGRVGIACASGWHVNDFVLAPANYQRRREIMAERIVTIKKLWRGDPITLPNGAAKPVEVRIYPRPIQPDLPIWLASHSDATFIKAGEIGAHVLTVLWDTQVEVLARRIRLYRKARAHQGLDPQQGKVALMLHTYIGDTPALVREHVTSAYEDYLFVNLGLQDDQLRSFDEQTRRNDPDTRFIVDRATEELFRSRGLVGTPDLCLEKLASLQAIGVDEVACLIDFGIAMDATLRSLAKLRDLQHTYNAR